VADAAGLIGVNWPFASRLKTEMVLAPAFCK
jgi:hypothetical protein